MKHQFLLFMYVIIEHGLLTFYHMSLVYLYFQSKQEVDNLLNQTMLMKIIQYKY